VILRVPARYGYERLLIELNRKLNEQIFVNQTEIMEQYLMISEITDCITSNKHNSRIHLMPAYLKVHEDYQKDKNCLKIHLSAMYWSKWNDSKPFVRAMGGERLRICYATHSSFSEIRDFIKFLKPSRVYPTVMPEAPGERTKMLTLIDEIISSYRDTPAQDIQPIKRFAFKRLRRNESK
jgi:hypothetical protein